MRKSELYRRVIEYFEQAMPVAETELHYGSPFQLLVAVVLSAQCTDKRVNMVTPALFAAYPTAEAMAQASEEDIFSYIHSVSYPNNKSHHLAGLSRMLVEEFGGEVPDDRDQLQRLPGVGRKTANVVEAVYFDRPAMPVDTHVFRVANRIGLTVNSKTPLQTERELVKYIPEQLLPKAHHWLILHGRYVCQARKPKCGECGLTEVCCFFRRQETGDKEMGDKKTGDRKTGDKEIRRMGGKETGDKEIRRMGDKETGDKEIRRIGGKETGDKKTGDKEIRRIGGKETGDKEIRRTGGKETGDKEIRRTGGKETGDKEIRRKEVKGAV